MDARKLFMRIWNTIAAATISALDDSKSVLLAQLKIGYLEIKDPTPVVQQFGFSSVPPIGSDASVLFVAGDRSNGWVCATNHQETRPTGKLSGETMVYDALGRQIYLSQEGIVVKANNSPVTVDGATTLTINAATNVVMNVPILQVSGDIIDRYGSNTDTVADMRAKYNAHVHGGVQSGSGSTGTPTPTM